MKAVIGLGNPGTDYAGTRHNVGFEVVDDLAGRLRARWVAAGGAEVAEVRDRKLPDPVLLVKPMTYMNRSGEPLRRIAAERGMEPADLLVVVDDFQLALGRLRVRASGSHGGHNGLRSILGAFGDGFPRIRLGIGEPPDRVPVEDFVLSRFKPAERKEVEEMVWRGADAAWDWLRGDPVDALMGRYNGPA